MVKLVSSVETVCIAEREVISKFSENEKKKKMAKTQNIINLKFFENKNSFNFFNFNYLFLMYLELKYSFFKNKRKKNTLLAK